MEQFILGLLQEQLGKFIVGFRKEMVNASLLNGKGEITDLHLNCAAINQLLCNVVPSVELDSVHISKVAFQVTSWTNLRKAPILVDVEHITVHISEPLHYLYPRKRQRIRQMTVSEMEQHFATLQAECKRTKTPFSNPNKRGGYNLVDRIVDNLQIEIKSIYVQFQTWGKFKTRRPGPWTPPTIQFMLRNLRYCSVDEFGQEGASPDDHWAHNHKPQPRGQDRTLLVFKRVSMDYDFGVTTIDGHQFSLLKGGRGVVPPQQKKEAAKAAEAKPASPTAAETVAALAESLGGPVTIVEGEPDSKAAAEAVAAMALGEPANNASKDEGTQTEVDEKAKEFTTNDPEKEKPDNTALPSDQKDDNKEAGEKKDETETDEQKEDSSPTSSDDEENKKDSTSKPAYEDDSTAKPAIEENKKDSTSKPPDDEDKKKDSKPEDNKKKDSSSVQPTDDCNNKVVVQMAMKRRVKDGALLAIQIDTTLSKVEVQIPAEVVPHLVHAALGLQFCLSKDRGFEDPLRNVNDRSNHNDARAAKPKPKKAEQEEGKEDGENDTTTKSETAEDAAGPEEGTAKDEEATVKEANTTSNLPTNEGTKDEEEATVKEDNTTSNPPSTDDGRPEEEKTCETQPEESGENANDKPETANEEKEADPNEACKDDTILLKLPSIALEDNASIAGDALSVLGETDNDTLEGSTVSQQLKPVDENKAGFGMSISNFFSRKSVTTESAGDAALAAAAVKAPTPPATPSSRTVDRAIIMLPNGLVIHEKISFSVTVERATMRGVYASPTEPITTSITTEESKEDTKENGGAKEKEEKPPDTARRKEQDDYIQLDCKGAVVELIWPKSNLEKGGYAQVSVSYVSVQERFGKRIRTVVSGGERHGAPIRPVEKGGSLPKEVDIDEAFPLFEDRAIREDPLEMRRTYPAQAMGLMSKISFQKRKKTPPKPPSATSVPTTITTGNENDDAASAVASVHNASQDGSTALNTSQDESLAPNISQHDNAQEEQAPFADGLVEVMMVNNDVGVDQINFLLDCDCWCRTLRFLMNESGGGFDGRWNSGDWVELLKSDMLVHPNVPLELDDHLQPLKLFYLDDNEFVSSDLFHVNAQIKNCELRVPAAIEHNVRSCDIVALVDETLVTVSSDLPRAFPSSNIGNTFSEGGNESPDATIKFPNDPSDVSIELVRGEDPSKRQSYMMTTDTEKLVKAKSSFRLEVKLRGMSTQIVPVIPFYTFSEPQQLMAPTDMTVGFAFEGEPPETEDSNLIKMVLFSSVVVKQIQMNCDLELMAGATSTILHHVHVVKETVEFAKQLVPVSVAADDENSVSNCDGSNHGEDDLSSTTNLYSTSSAGRIRKSLRGRGILVHRQLHRSRETGGLSFGIFLQVEDYDLTLWRQNVSLYAPIRFHEGVDVVSALDRHKIQFPLLKLLSCTAKNIETGIEVSFPEDERRVVLKCGVSQARLSLCDLTGDGTSDTADNRSPTPQDAQNQAEPTPDGAVQDGDAAPLSSHGHPSKSPDVREEVEASAEGTSKNGDVAPPPTDLQASSPPEVENKVEQTPEETVQKGNIAPATSPPDAQEEVETALEGFQSSIATAVKNVMGPIREGTEQNEDIVPGPGEDQLSSPLDVQEDVEVATVDTKEKGDTTSEPTVDPTSNSPDAQKESEATAEDTTEKGAAASEFVDDQSSSPPEVKEASEKGEVAIESTDNQSLSAQDTQKGFQQTPKETVHVISDANEDVLLEKDEQVDSNSPKVKGQAMVDIFQFGYDVPINPRVLPKANEAMNRDKAILIRCEECYRSCRARSVAADVGTGGIVNLHVDQFESVFVLVLEALMMPTWSKSMAYPLKEKKRFPEKSVGALFHALLPGKGERFRLLKILRKLIALALPQDLRLLLLHVRMAEVLVNIPEVLGQHTTNLMAKKGVLMLRHFDLVTWYISSHDDPFSRNMFSVVASKECQPWASLISQEAPGVNYRVACEQSFHIAHMREEARRVLCYVELLPEFEMALEYLKAKLSTSVENTSSLHDTQTLRDCFRFLRRFASRCVDMFFYLKRRLSVLKRREEHDEDSLVDESNEPISVACSDIGNSIRAVKALLLRMSMYIDEDVLGHADALNEKEAEVERLQQLVFVKEKERIAAVALASSPIAGWLRVGGTHQSGLRLASTSTLWRYWAVLRKEIMVLYSAPGKFKPVDMLSLRGARLRVLAGGKSKWDLKRSFGIVESNGKTRFFVVGSEDEYNSWTREIEKVIRSYTLPEKEETEKEEDMIVEAKETATNEKKMIVDVDNNDPLPKSSTDRDEESVGVESAGPNTTDSVQSDQGATSDSSSKIIRSKLSGFGSFLRKPKQDPTTPVNENEAGSQAGISAEETTAATTDVTEEQDASISNQSEVGDSEEKSPTNGSSRSPQAGDSVSTTKRLQLKEKVVGVGGKVASVGGAVGGKVAIVGGAVGGKVAGVGQATGRWGSSLFAATRQKGREVADRSRRSTTSGAGKGDELSTSGHNTLHVITEEERNWTCPTCTFINSTKETDMEFVICAMCETPTEVGKIEFEQPQESAEIATELEPVAKTEADQEPNRDRLVSNDSDKGIFRRQSSEPVDFRDRLNSGDSDPDIFRRTQSSENFGNYFGDEDETSIISDLAMDEISEAARSGGRRPSRQSRLGGLLGSGRKSRQGRPNEPQSESKGWFSRLGSTNSSQDEGEPFQKTQPALKLKNIRINPNIEFTCEDTPAINVPLQKLDGRWFVLVSLSEEGAAIPAETDAFMACEGLGKDDDSATTPKNSSTSGQRPASSRSLMSRGQDSKERHFCLQIFHRGSSEDTKQPKGTVIRSFSEIVSFHNVMSECIVDLIHHPLFYEKSFERTTNGVMSTGLKNALGISPLDTVRISGAFLAGIVDALQSNPPLEVPPTRQAETVMEFLNSSLECPLSSTALYALTEFLGTPNAPSSEILFPTDSLLEDMNEDMEALLVDNDTAPDEVTKPAEDEGAISHLPKEENAKTSSDTVMSLSSQCMAELLQAEQNGKLATDLLNISATTPFETANEQQSPLLPNHVTENLQNSMHVALMKVMAERDEAHAQLVSASVLHVHNVEQERKKVERLEAKLELANKLAQKNQLVALPRFGLDRKKAQEEQEEREKSQKKQAEMQQNSDAEIVALCEQLTSEISSRTQAALEVVRLKESRGIERKHETEEKNALRDELVRVKELLAQEQQKAQEAQQEAGRWKQYYERAMKSEKSNQEES